MGRVRQPQLAEPIHRHRSVLIGAIPRVAEMSENLATDLDHHVGHEIAVTRVRDGEHARSRILRVGGGGSAEDHAPRKRLPAHPDERQAQDVVIVADVHVERFSAWLRASGVPGPQAARRVESTGHRGISRDRVSSAWTASSGLCIRRRKSCSASERGWSPPINSSTR